MTCIAINDLALRNELDHQAMSALSGGGTALLYTGTSYSSWSTSFLRNEQTLKAYGWYNGKWAAWYDYKKVYKQTRTMTKNYEKIVWSS